MLVLSRYPDQTLRLDLTSLIPLIAASPETLASILSQPIDIMVVAVSGEKVRMGFNCNRTIAVHRSEVYEAIQRDKQTTVPE